MAWSAVLSAAFHQNLTVQQAVVAVLCSGYEMQAYVSSIYTCTQACWMAAIPFKGGKIKPSRVAHWHAHHAFLEAAGKKGFDLQPQKENPVGETAQWPNRPQRNPFSECGKLVFIKAVKWQFEQTKPILKTRWKALEAPPVPFASASLSDSSLIEILTLGARIVHTSFIPHASGISYSRN